MPIVKIGPKHQVTIPKDVFQKLRLATGDFLDVQVTDEGILMVPQKLIPKDQAWFYTDSELAGFEVSGRAAGVKRS